VATRNTTVRDDGL